MSKFIKPADLNENITPDIYNIIKDSSGIDLLDFHYPNSIKMNLDGENLDLESSDSIDLITNWYKDKINSLGLTSKSFVATNTNGHVLNHLVGADNDREVVIEIIKPSNQNITKIRVQLYV